MVLENGRPVGSDVTQFATNALDKLGILIHRWQLPSAGERSRNCSEHLISIASRNPNYMVV
jgi:hypothetical protein